MDAIVFDTLLTAVTGMLTHAIPGWVEAHPKAALAAITAYAILEHLWPFFKAKGWVQGNSTLGVLLSAIGSVLKKKGA